MGRVFRFSEVRSRQVPTAADFEIGKADIWRTLEQCEDVFGGIVCGSIVHNSYNLRSDIDLVLYHLATDESEEVIKSLRQRCAARNLELNIVPVDPIIADTRYHTLSWGYLRHLELSATQGGLIKRNFLHLVCQDYVDPFDDIAEYISFKLRYLCKSIDELEQIDSDNIKHVEILQKGLELPVHVARKYLWDPSD